MMANYVVDASVVTEYLIAGTFTANTQAFFSQMTAADTLNVPEFCLLECTNVIWKQVRFSGLSRGDAKGVLKALRALKLNHAPMKRLLDQSLDIALNYTLAVYDSAYIALAKRSGYPLISIDQAQIRAATAERVTVIPITTFNL